MSQFCFSESEANGCHDFLLVSQKSVCNNMRGLVVLRGKGVAKAEEVWPRGCGDKVLVAECNVAKADE